MLTSEQLEAFVGGDLEIQKGNAMAGGTVFRGPVKGVQEIGIQCLVELYWCGHMIELGRWEKWDEVTHLLPPVLTDVQPDADGRLIISGGDTIFVFFPPNGSKLDREKVSGLH